ncbi:hypothetical protein [Azospirillum sp.]|uniref:hypothetical protein n=1 Tax=Azospirillum sp. TaxID=34012 RepID=UPI003D707E99
MFEMSDDQQRRHRMPDYRTMARHLAALSAEAAEMARRNGDPRFAALAERLKSCSDQIRTDTAKRG